MSRHRPATDEMLVYRLDETRVEKGSAFHAGYAVHIAAGAKTPACIVIAKSKDDLDALSKSLGVGSIDHTKTQWALLFKKDDVQQLRSKPLKTLPDHAFDEDDDEL